MFRDEGAFDRRAYLAFRSIDLAASLRSATLMTLTNRGAVTPTRMIDRARRRMRDEVDTLFAARPQVAAVLRAMLLGDRTFVDRDESVSFPEDRRVPHPGRRGLARRRLGRAFVLDRAQDALFAGVQIVFVLALLIAYVAIVEQRAPVLRAVMMAGIVLLAASFPANRSAQFAALAALAISGDAAVGDPRLQFSAHVRGDRLHRRFGAALARRDGATLRSGNARVERRHARWRTRATRDSISTRCSRDVQWVSARGPSVLAKPVERSLAGTMAACFRLWELFVLTIVLQLGMLPLMAANFHRITLSAPIREPRGCPDHEHRRSVWFFHSRNRFDLRHVREGVCRSTEKLTLLLLGIVKWFAGFPHWSYRIPGPPGGLVFIFFAVAIALAIVAVSVSCESTK